MMTEWTPQSLRQKVDEIGPWHYCHQFPFDIVTGTSPPDQVPKKIVDMQKRGAFKRPIYPKVLDLGANSGLISMWVADNKGSRVVAVEAGPKYYPQLALAVEVKGYADRIKPRMQDIYECEFGDNIYDLVLFLGTLHHIAPEKHVQVLEACNRALQPGGEIYVQTRPDIAVVQLLERADFHHIVTLYADIDGRGAWSAMKDPMKIHNDYQRGMRYETRS